MATRVFDGIKFCEQSLKKTSQGTILPSLVQIGPAFWEEMFKQEGHNGPVSLHWLIREIHSYQTLHYLGIGLKHNNPNKD